MNLTRHRTNTLRTMGRVHPMGDLTTNLFGSAVYSGVSTAADALVPGSSWVLTAGNALFGGPSSVSPGPSGTITNIPGSDFLYDTSQFPTSTYDGSFPTDPVTTSGSGTTSQSNSLWDWLGLPSLPTSVSLLPALPTASVFAPSPASAAQTPSWLIPAVIGGVLLIVLTR